MTARNAKGHDFAALGIPVADETTRDLVRALLGLIEPTDAVIALLRQALDRAGNSGIRRLLPIAMDMPWFARVADPAGPEARGQRRRDLLTTMAYDRLTSEIVDLLAAGGIIPLALKGVALRRLYYAAPAHRPASDIDLAVREEDWEPALALLHKAGFSGKPGPQAERLTRFDHQYCLIRNGDGFEFDLHRRIVGSSPWEEVDDRLWARADTMRIGAQALRTLSPSDHFFQTCLHGCLPNAVSPVRWIVDAALILRGALVDWAVVIDEAGRERCSWLIGAAIAYLRGDIGLSIPREVVDQLEAIEMPARDRAYFRSFAVMNTAPSRIGRLRHAIHVYHRAVPANAGVSFMEWNRERWGGAILRPAARLFAEKPV